MPMCYGPPGPRGPRGEKGDKGDRGDPGRDGRDACMDATKLVQKDQLSEVAFSGEYSDLEGTPDLTGISDKGTVEEGWSQLPNGLIIQWGNYLAKGSYGNKGDPTKFPIAFPNACFTVVATHAHYEGEGEGNNEARAIGVREINKEGFRAAGRQYTGKWVDTRVGWMALGN